MVLQKRIFKIEFYFVQHYRGILWADKLGERVSLSCYRQTVTQLYGMVLLNTLLFLTTNHHILILICTLSLYNTMFDLQN